MLYHSLKGIGYAPRPIATQSLGKNYYWGHATLSVRIEHQNYIIDPTFIQFIDVHDSKSIDRNVAPNSSAEELLKKILENGFFKLTPKSAHDYLTMLCADKPAFETAEESYRFCPDPPHHSLHLVAHGNNTTYSTEELVRYGLALEFK